MEYDDILWPGGGVTCEEMHDPSESQELVVLAMLHYTSSAQTLARCACVASMLANTENGMVVPAAGGECKLVLNVYKTAKVYQQFAGKGAGSDRPRIPYRVPQELSPRRTT
jgi:hypothetical protein